MSNLGHDQENRQPDRKEACQDSGSNYKDQNHRMITLVHDQMNRQPD